jgi:hypothetical protein
MAVAFPPARASVQRAVVHALKVNLKLRSMHSPSLPNSEAIRSEKRAFAFSAKPTLYTLVLLLSVFGAFAYKLRSQGIFGCPADGYGANHYLAYCHSTAYGDFDRGAFWFGLEPEARRFAGEAEVLFLGSSRMQFAFSTQAAINWFSAAGVTYYLLGFTHIENAVFAAPLLSRLKPRAKVYVINVDQFFDGRETPPTGQILRGTDSLTRYKEKQFWQSPHRVLCTAVPAVCGSNFAYFRLRATGAWQHAGWAANYRVAPVSDGTVGNADRWKDYSAAGEEFLSRLPVDRHCIFLTLAPYVDTKRAEASAIASALGLDLVAPQLDGLQTFDGYHLDQPSAEHWSTAFFETAGPRIRECLDKPKQDS